jgi:hypothetical protein
MNQLLYAAAHPLDRSGSVFAAASIIARFCRIRLTTARSLLPCHFDGEVSYAASKKQFAYTYDCPCAADGSRASEK